MEQRENAQKYLLACLSSILFLLCSFLAFAGESSERVQRFKRWFWSVVEKMNNVERQDLVGCLFDLIMCFKSSFLLFSSIFLMFFVSLFGLQEKHTSLSVCVLACLTFYSSCLPISFRFFLS